MHRILGRGARLIGALLLCGGLLGAAPVAAQTAAPVPAEDPRWLQAGAAVRDGRLQNALPLLEALVAASPDDARYRLELAAVLLRLGQGARARFHLARARGARLDPDTLAIVNGLLAGLPLRTGLERRLSFTIAPESNPARGSTGFILVGGIPVEIGAAGAGRSGISYGAEGAIGWQIAMRPDTAAFVDASLAYTARTGALEDTATLRGRAGWRAVRGATRIEGALRWSQTFVADTPLAQGPGVSLDISRPLGTHGQIHVGAVLDDLTYDALPGLNGPEGRVTLGYSHSLSPATRLSFALGYSHRDAQAAGSDVTTVTQVIGIDHSLRGGLSVGLTAARNRSWRDAPQGFFTIIPKDTRDTLTLRLRHSKVSVLGFAPVLEFSRERQRSNIPLNRYDNDRASVGLTRRF